MTSNFTSVCLVLYFGLISAVSHASETVHVEEHGGSCPACVGFGPQTPRDIDNKVGGNPQTFSLAPEHKEMNLCNIHFHNNAEHKAKDFSIYVNTGNDHSGYQCEMSRHLTRDELRPTGKEICKGLKPGDTIEVHWVYSSCQVKPGYGLGSCMSSKCSNPDLRVETQVFTLVNAPQALSFKRYDYTGKIVNGRHQADSLPTGTGNPVEFMGSTTGPEYSESTCSPLQVTWGVRPKCAKLDINSLGAWCEKNSFHEDHAHGVRKLVINPKLLSNIE